MLRIVRPIKQKRNIRRILAAMFLFVLVVEMGSHVVIDAQDPSTITETLACSANENLPARADCPEQRRQRQETKNLIDEMTTHMVVLNSIVVPHSGISYRSPDNYMSSDQIVSRSLPPPFQPPKQS